MSEKEPRSINFTKENLEYIDRNCNNRSGFVNDLVEAHRQGTSDMKEAVARFRAEQLRSQKADLKGRLGSIESELEKVEDNLTKAREQNKVKLSEAKQALSETPKDTDNPAIQHWADELNMTPEDLIDEL